MVSGSAVFVDTSIQIARIVHSPETKRRITRRLKQYDLVISSLVVKQEFKRRLLKEAKYLLEQLERLGSFGKLLRHVADVLPPQQMRKRNICLQLLLTVDEQDTDRDRTDRARLLLRSLVRDGLEEFEDMLGSVIRDTACACGSRPVRIRGSIRSRYEFGTDRCSRTDGTCGIVAFLRSRESDARRLLAYLQGVPANQKTDEVKSAERFLDKVLAKPPIAVSLDPCLRVGDLIIALESIGVPTFYTLNGKESQHFCRASDQNLIVCPTNPGKDEVVCSRTEPSWPAFGGAGAEQGEHAAAASDESPTPGPLLPGPSVD